MIERNHFCECQKSMISEHTEFLNGIPVFEVFRNLVFCTECGEEAVIGCGSQ